MQDLECLAINQQGLNARLSSRAVNELRFAYKAKFTNSTIVVLKDEKSMSW
jgi:hypothetical protein